MLAYERHIDLAPLGTRGIIPLLAVKLCRGEWTLRNRHRHVEVSVSAPRTPLESPGASP